MAPWPVTHPTPRTYWERPARRQRHAGSSAAAGGYLPSGGGAAAARSTSWPSDAAWWRHAR